MAKKFFDIVPPKSQIQDNADKIEPASNASRSDAGWQRNFPLKKEKEEIKPEKVEVFERAPIKEKITGEDVRAKKESARPSALATGEAELQKKTSKIPALLAVFFIFLIIAGGVFSYSYFSKTKIIIQPKVEFASFNASVNINANSGSEPMGEVFQEEQSVSQEFQSTGKIQKEQRATGVIKVYNAYSTSSQTLVVRTRFVSASGKLFRSLKKAVIPGGTYEKGKLVPGTVDVEIQAVEPGEEYNIGATTFSVPGFLGTPKYTAFYGKSFSPMANGFSGEVFQVSKEDLDNAKNTLAENLKIRGREALKNKISQEYILLDETISQEITENRSSIQQGQESGGFNYFIKVKSRGLALKRSELDEVAKNAVKAGILENKNFQEESLEVRYLPKVINWEKGNFTVDLEIKAKIYPDINLDIIKKALLGKSLKEAEIFLENQPQIERVEVKTWPFWKTKIPDAINKVEVSLNLD